jgi:hypothetical protein
MVKKSKAGKKTKKFGGKRYTLDWEVTGKGSKKWADVRKQELRKEGYNVRVEKRQKPYKIGSRRGRIQAHRVYKRKK